jgi:hypothetical protein
MNIDEHNEIIKRSKTKKDGIYTYKKNFYLVYKNQLAAYCDYMGNVYEYLYGFNVSKGKLKDRFEGYDLLKSYLKQYKLTK